MKQKRLVVDCSNLFWRAVSAQQKYGPANAADSAGLGLHMCLMSLRKHYNSIKPQKIAVAFEGKQNWRKEYTKSEQCYSKRLYKGNRVLDPNMAVLFDVIKNFEELVREHTNIVTLQHPMLEGDDLISGYAQYYGNPHPGNDEGDEIVILSGDKDFAQELDNPNVSLINPDDGKPRQLIDLCGVDDAGYFMFEKAFRGDAGDNVLPALPRVRKTRLQKAYGVRDGVANPEWADAFELSNLLDTQWEYTDPESGDKRQMHVEKMFEENNLLMNLKSQPDNIRALIRETIVTQADNHGQFNFFKFQQFIGKYKLAAIGEKSSDFVGLFSGTGFAAQKTTVSAKKLGGLEF